MKLSALPRIRLANLPTPLQELPNLSRRLGGPRIFVKRDDLTGLAFGGNKTRKLEYLMADAVEQGSDYIVTGAAFHSNWCSQSAAAARRVGMRVALIKNGPEEGYDPGEYDGNHLLHFLMGAEMKVVRPEDADMVTEETLEELRAAGHRPYHLEATGSTPPGVAGYINGMLELLSQAVELGVDIDYVIHATGSGGTQAGLIIGAKAFNTGIKVVGSTSGSSPRKEQIAKVSRRIDEALRFLELDLDITEDDVIVHDQYAGGGYGFMTEEKARAVRIAAETEGLFLDPVYTASSMACMIDLCERELFKPDDVVVFINTGGSAALFPYKEALKAYALGEKPPWTIPPWSHLMDR